jgi:hypothetical protein
MLERTFVCKGFDGKQYEETYGFYLSRADLLKINLGSFVGLDVLMQRLIDAQNGVEIMNIIDKIIMTAVGRESADHRKFLRNDEIRDEFRQSDAYSQLFEELVTDAEKASQFLISCLPEDLARTALANKQKMAEEKAE